MDTGKRMPNLANAFKYAMSQSVTLFGAFHTLYLMYISDGEVDVSLVDDDDSSQDEQEQSNFFFQHAMVFQLFWMGLFIASSLYSFCWDVYMDWGEGQLRCQLFRSIFYLSYPTHIHTSPMLCASMVTGLGRREHGFLGTRLMFPKRSYYYTGE